MNAVGCSHLHLSVESWPVQSLRTRPLLKRPAWCRLTWIDRTDLFLQLLVSGRRFGDLAHLLHFLLNGLKPLETSTSQPFGDFPSPTLEFKEPTPPKSHAETVAGVYAGTSFVLFLSMRGAGTPFAADERPPLCAAFACSAGVGCCGGCGGVPVAR